MRTRWHNTFHILVFGSLGALLFIVLAVKKEYRVGNELAGESEKHSSIPAEAASKKEKLPETVYGAGTPEETLAMFLDALKAGDPDLASRYFVTSRRNDWQESLRKIKVGGGLAAMYQELSEASALLQKETITDNEASYSYQSQHIVFIRDAGTQKWEIQDL